jgi:hypothetical protein
MAWKNMKTIWKWPLERGVRHQHVTMPIGTTIISVGLQGMDVCIWGVCDPTAPPEVRAFFVAGTGHELSQGLGRHLGTAIMPDDQGHVYHVFEAIQPLPASWLEESNR